MGLDLFLRWLAFGRVDAVAVDVWTFSFVFYLPQLFNQENKNISIVLLTTSLIGWVITVTLHRSALSKVEDLVEDMFDNLFEINNDSKCELLRRLKRNISQYIQVTFSKKKSGKMRRNREFLELLQSVDINIGDLNQEGFLLGAATRKRWLFGFFASTTIFALVQIFGPFAVKNWWPS